MNLLLAAGESAGLQTLKAIANTPHLLVGVIASEAKNGFSGASVASLAAKLGVPIWPGSLVRDPDFQAIVRTLSVDVLLNVHSLHRIHPAVLEAPRLGSFNLHPGPLPECAGLNAPSWAIYEGARTHRVTLHWMAAAIDTGPIVYSEQFPIEDTDTGVSLAVKCIRAGVPLVERLLHTAAFEPAAIPRVAQTPGARRYHRPGPPNGGRLSWSASARQNFDFVRAADYRPFQSPWGHPRAHVGAHEFGIVSARRTGRRTDEPAGTIGAVSDEGISVACSDEWLLVREVQQGKRYEHAFLVLESIDCLP
jgi:methionyl-tRNA formyltransferase